MERALYLMDLFEQYAPEVVTDSEGRVTHLILRIPVTPPVEEQEVLLPTG